MWGCLQKEWLQCVHSSEKGAFFRIWLEKLENHRFFPALGGKAGILFLGLIISSGIIKWKMILSRNMIKEEKIVQHNVDKPFFTKSTEDWKVSLRFGRVVVRFIPSGGGLPEDIENFI